MDQRVYLDNAATTFMPKEILEPYIEYIREFQGNPSSVYEEGRKSKGLIESARKYILTELKASKYKCIFTSGATESINGVIKSLVFNKSVTKIVCSPLEHSAIIACVEEVKVKFGIQLEWLSVNHCGELNLKEIEQHTSDTGGKTLVVAMYVNNEIGNINPVKEIGQICQKNNALYFCDAVQAIGVLDVNFDDIGADIIIASGHKFFGPKGVAFSLIKKERTDIQFQIGGGQERGVRAGTENPANIGGMHIALQWSIENRQSHYDHLVKIKSYAIEQLKKLEGVDFNGKSDCLVNSTPKTLHFSLPSDKAPMVAFQLDMKGISLSQGSACSSGSNKGSHVIRSLNKEDNREQLRISFSHETTSAHIDYLVQCIQEIMV